MQRRKQGGQIIRIGNRWYVRYWERRNEVLNPCEACGKPESLARALRKMLVRLKMSITAAVKELGISRQAFHPCLQGKLPRRKDFEQGYPFLLSLPVPTRSSASTESLLSTIPKTPANVNWCSRRVNQFSPITELREAGADPLICMSSRL